MKGPEIWAKEGQADWAKKAHHPPSSSSTSPSLSLLSSLLFLFLSLFQEGGGGGVTSLPNIHPPVQKRPSLTNSLISLEMHTRALPALRPGTWQEKMLVAPPFKQL